MNTKEIFMETYQKYIHRPGAASLLNWLLSTDFFEAPASTKYHGNYAGGLALHVCMNMGRTAVAVSRFRRSGWSPLP